MSDIKDIDLRSNKIVLRSVYGKSCKYVIQPVKDPRTGRYPACVRQVNKDGDIILSELERADANAGKVHYIPVNAQFTIEDGTVFDLNDLYQAAEWEAIKNCNIIAESRDAKDAKGILKIDGDVSNNGSTARYGRAELYIDRPGLAAKKNVSKARKKHNAVEYIITDNRGPEGHRLMAKLLGRNMDNQSDVDVEDYLILRAEKDPDSIINLYSGDDLQLRILFMEAKEKRVISYHDKFYWYGENLIAATDEAVVTWMKLARNAKSVELIRKETYPDLFDEEPTTGKKK